MTRHLSALLLVILLAAMLTACANVVLVPVPVPVSAQASPTTVAEGHAVVVADAKTSQTGAATPEEAVAQYIQGVIEGDLKAVFDAAATRDIARKFSFVRFVDRLRALPAYQSFLPTDDAFFVQMNEARAEQQIAGQVSNLVLVLLAGSLVDMERGMTAPVDGDWAADVEALLDMSRLGAIELFEIAPPDEELMASDRYQENAQRTAEMYGADEYTERVAVFGFEDSVYLLGFQLLRYGNNWYVLSQTSPLAGTPASGVPIKQ